METETKTCSHCKTAKPLDQYGVNRQSKDGLSYWCKECLRGREKSKRTGEKSRRQEGKKATAPRPAEVRSWRDAWTNPTLSQLEGLRKHLGAPSLDDAAAVLNLIASAAE